MDPKLERALAGAKYTENYEDSYVPAPSSEGSPRPPARELGRIDVIDVKKRSKIWRGCLPAYKIQNPNKIEGPIPSVSKINENKPHRKVGEMASGKVYKIDPDAMAPATATAGKTRIKIMIKMNRMMKKWRPPQRPKKPMKWPVFGQKPKF